VAGVGGTILLVGLLLLVLPGPGVVVVLIGLAVLGSEFVWARRMIQRARELRTDPGSAGSLSRSAHRTDVQNAASIAYCHNLVGAMHRQAGKHGYAYAV
jgi:hypothetical protein